MKKLIIALVALVAVLAAPAVVMAAPTLMEGDFTGDGKTNIIDAMSIAQYVVDPQGTAGILWFVPTPDNIECGDVNDDGVTNIIDAMLIAQWVVDPNGTAGILSAPLWDAVADAHLLPPAN